MTCNECRELLASYAVQALDEPEAGQVRAHLQTDCAQCAKELLQLQSVLDVLPLSLAPVTPTAALRAKLMDRIAPQPQRIETLTAPVHPTFRPSRPWRLVEALVSGAIAALITTAIFWHFLDEQRKSVASLRDQLDQAQTAIRELRTSVVQTNDSIHLLQSPAVQLVSLDGTPAQPQAKARVLWNQTRGQWHFYASNLQRLSDAKVYELWLIDANQRKLPAGTFKVNQYGEATLVAQPPPDSAHIVALAVTDEPQSGSPQPTGQIQLLGQLK